MFYGYYLNLLQIYFWLNLLPCGYFIMIIIFINNFSFVSLKGSSCFIIISYFILIFGFFIINERILNVRVIYGYYFPIAFSFYFSYFIHVLDLIFTNLLHFISELYSIQIFYLLILTFYFTTPLTFFNHFIFILI
jgi:hypothetical protein